MSTSMTFELLLELNYGIIAQALNSKLFALNSYQLASLLSHSSQFTRTSFGFLIILNKNSISSCFVRPPREKKKRLCSLQGVFGECVAKREAQS